MCKLILFELEKIWKRQSFLLAMFLVVLVHIFLLWYTNLPDGENPDLSAYKMLEKELNGKSEKEKWEYIRQRYEDIQGVKLVNDVLNCQTISGEWGETLANQLKNDNPGVFEQYYDTYQNQDYLYYTGSLEQEYEFLTEVYEEIELVSGYQEYLEGIQKQKGTLNQISIFASDEGESFSERNIEKSAADYVGLENAEICFYPSRGVAGAVKSGFQDVLLLVSVFLFASSLIYEEKEKKLFYVTRATVRGRLCGISAKLLALLIHCIGVTLLLYGINLLWYGSQAGLGDLSRSIQSVAPFMDCTLRWNVLEGIICMILAKAAVVFVLGMVVTAASIALTQAFMPLLLGAVVLLVSLLFYLLVPDYSVMNSAKYLNLIGLMQTDILYGGYLNFNFGGYPVSRLVAAPVALGIYMLAGIGINLGLFLSFRTPELKTERLLSEIQRKLPFHHFLQFQPHASLYRHESYKILIMNRALAVLLLFCLFSAWQHLSAHYSLSPYETYYQNMLIRLEGELTEEKEILIESEQQRHEDAFTQIARIEEQIAAGEINEMTGESLKSPYYNEVAFYPAFEKILIQYKRAKEQGTGFIYDTAYLCLFGVGAGGNQEDGVGNNITFSDSVFLTDLILFSLCLILSFSSVLSMEYEKKSWNLLSAAAVGKREILKTKNRICLISSVLISLVPWLCRLVSIYRSYPLRRLLCPLDQIPAFYESGLKIPVGIWLFVMLLVQMLTFAAVTQIIFFLSGKMKKYLQALFVGVLVLIVPLLLTAMGFDFMGWCSFLPLYQLTSMVLKAHGLMIAAGYGAAAVLLLVCTFFQRMLHKAAK